MYMDDKVYLGQITANNAIVVTPDQLDLAKRSLGDGEPLVLVFVIQSVGAGATGLIRFEVLRQAGLTPAPATDPVAGMLDVDAAALGLKIRQVVVPFEVPEGDFNEVALYGIVDSSTRGTAQIIANVYAAPRNLAKQDYLDHHEAQKVV